MNHEKLLDVLYKTAIGLHKLLGKDTEIVLHDLKTRTVKYIANSEISGRDMDYRINPDTSNAIVSLADSEGHLIGLNQKSSPVDHLKSSHFVYYEEGEPSALICINQDMTKMEEFRDYLNSLLRSEQDRNDSGIDEKNYIMKMTKQIIVDTMDTFSSAELATKEGKLKLLTKLYETGILSVRDSAAMICQAVGMSNSSLYNYIRELKEKGVIDKAMHLPPLY